MRIARQLFSHILGKVRQVYRMGRKRVVACDCFPIGSQNENRRHSLADILACLLLKITIQRFYATRKSRSIMPAA